MLKIKLFFLLIFFASIILIKFLFSEKLVLTLPVQNNVISQKISIIEQPLIPKAEPEKEPAKTELEAIADFILLKAPYINEAPSGNWTGPWKNACEEASIAIVEKYYQGKQEVSVKEAKEYMQTLFRIQDELYGSNADADTARLIEIINKAASFKGKIKENPTIDDIKEQIRNKNLVITPHYGYDLKNPNIPFALRGSYYHMMVVVGYDDAKKEFIVHDTGDIKTGANHRYNYELFMNSIHDFDFKTKKATGPARVIFTRLP